MISHRITLIFLAGATLAVLLRENSLYDIEFILPFGTVLFAFYFIKLLVNFGKRMLVGDVLEVMSVTYLLFVPALFKSYDTEYLEQIQLQMPMSEKYFVLAIPTVMATLIGLALPLFNRYANEKNIIKANEDPTFQKVGMILFVSGMAFTFINNVFPMGFISEFLSGLAKVGVLYLLFSGHRLKLVILYSYLGMILLESLGRGMIGPFFWWISLMGMFYLMIYPISLLRKLAYASVFFLCIGILQSIKAEYRMATWKNQGELAGMSSVDVYKHLLSERLDFGQIFSQEESLGSLSRLNQGYLTSMAIEYTPAVEPFAKGETIALALASSLVPRVLWPDKPRAGGSDMMLRFTGFDIGESGMNIGIIGEAYVNFGFWGATIFMFLYGLMLNYVYSRFLEAGQTHPFIVLWLPIAFFGLFSVESDFLTTINHIVKFLMFFFVLYYMSAQFFKVKLW